MNTRNYIEAYSYINNHIAIANGEEIFLNNEKSNFSDYINALYKHLNIDYPKFFKMDNVSKLGFLGSEILLNNNDISKVFEKEGIGIVLSNSASSLDTDLKFNALIMNEAEYFPSPSTFVYTLPNIVMGEICIRNGIKGENAFFIFDQFNPEFLSNYVSTLLQKNKINACILGWVNIIGEDYESFLIFVEKKESSLQSAKEIELTTENLKNIYQRVNGNNN